MDSGRKKRAEKLAADYDVQQTAAQHYTSPIALPMQTSELCECARAYNFFVRSHITFYFQFQDDPNFLRSLQVTNGGMLIGKTNQQKMKDIKANLRISKKNEVASQRKLNQQIQNQTSIFNKNKDADVGNQDKDNQSRTRNHIKSA